MCKKSAVLIAEDMEILREHYASVVSSDPSFTIAAKVSSGAEATAICDAIPVDIILMDIEMEDATAGIRATETILSRHPQVKVVYLTAHETEQTIITSMATGAVDYLVKGCTDTHMLEHLRGVRDGTQNLDAKIQGIVMREYKRLHKSEQGLVWFITKTGTLTPTERELVRYLLDGYKVKQIAEERHVEVVTIKTQIHSLLVKFQCKRTTEVVRLIEQLGLGDLF